MKLGSAPSQANCCEIKRGAICYQTILVSFLNEYIWLNKVVVFMSFSFLEIRSLLVVCFLNLYLPCRKSVPMSLQTVENTGLRVSLAAPNRHTLQRLPALAAALADTLE